MTIKPVGYESTHFMVLPTPQFLGSPSPLNFRIDFSGVAVLENFKGNQNGTWRNDTLMLEITKMRMDKVIEKITNLLPPLQLHESYKFIPLQWIAYASVNSQFDQGSSQNAGFGAYNFGINRIDNKLIGMFVDIQVRDNDAQIFRVGYSLNVYGYFRKEEVIS